MNKTRKFGFLTKKQVEVLKLRAHGLTQAEVARKLGTTRANISMIELRAKRKIRLAEETLKVVSSIRSQMSIRIEKGTYLADIPSIVLRSADKRGIHLKTNIVEIVRLVKMHTPPCIKKGRTTRTLLFKISPEGQLLLSEASPTNQED